MQEFFLTNVRFIVVILFLGLSLNSYSQEPPSGLIAFATGASQINIRWDNSSDYIEGTAIRIYRDGTFIFEYINEGGNNNSNNDIAYIDNRLVPDTEYIYSISFVDSTGSESAQSTSVNATTKPEPLTINPASQVLPASYLGDWINAGVEGGIPDYPVWSMNVKDYGAIGDGVNDDSQSILDAIEGCLEGYALFFPAGTYRITQNLSLSKAIVLRGESPATTHIIAEQDLGYGIASINIVSDLAGLENIHIHTAHDFTFYNGWKIQFNEVENSWVRNIETSGYIGMAIVLNNSHHCEIRDSYFHNSPEETLNPDIDFRAYGFNSYGESSSYNLVENNIFDWFRHSIVMQYYNLNNVIAYNFSWNIWSSGVGRSSTTDIEFHHIVYYPDDPSQSTCFTLVEGNNIDQGGHQNAAHRSNTWFRNRVMNGGIGTGNENNIIGNEFTEIKYPGVGFSVFGNSPRPGVNNFGYIIHGNYVTEPTVYHSEGLLWDDEISDHNIPTSYYLPSKPLWFGDIPWPCYGSDFMPGNTKRSPAEVRYWSILFPEESPSNLQGEIQGNSVVLTWDNNSTNTVDFIICRSSDSVNYERIGYTSETSYTDAIPGDGLCNYYVRARNHLGGVNGNDLGGESDPSNVLSIHNGTVSIEQSHVANNVMSIFPNPVSDVLYYNLGDNHAQTIAIYNILGQLVLEKKSTDNSIKISGLSAGIHFIVIKGEGIKYTAKFIIK